MAVDKKFVDKLVQNLVLFSENKIDELIYVLENLNNELRTAKEVVSLMEKNHLKDLNMTFEDFYENTLPTVISKTICDFFRNKDENVSKDMVRLSGEIKTLLHSDIGSSYNRYILKSLDNIPQIFKESNYVTQRLNSVEVVNSINNVRNNIHNEDLILINYLTTKISEVLESSRLLSKATSDVSKNIHRHHYDNNSFTARLFSTSNMFADITLSLLKQIQGSKDLANFYNSFSNFQKNKKLFFYTNDGDLSTIYAESRNFLKLILSFKTKLPQNEYEKFFEIVGIRVNNFLKEMESSRTSPSNLAHGENSYWQPQVRLHIM